MLKLFKLGQKGFFHITLLLLVVLVIAGFAVFSGLLPLGKIFPQKTSAKSVDKPKVARFSSNEILIKLNPTTTADLRNKHKTKKLLAADQTGRSSLDQKAKDVGAIKIQPVIEESVVNSVNKRGVQSNSERLKNAQDLDGWFKVTLKGARKDIDKKSKDFAILDKALKKYKEDPNVQKVSLNIKYEIAQIPNDPRYQSNELWGLNKIQAPQVWDLSTGSNDVLVAVVDSGVDYNHEDLAANMWSNTTDSCGDNIDNDGNGYVDDCRGWDFSDNDNNPMDMDTHGTHVAGIIGAIGNNSKGVVGVNWNVKLMPLKIFPNAHSDVIANAFAYATSKGAKVSNNSWAAFGFPTTDDVVHTAIKDAYLNGMTVVFGAGNAESDALFNIPASQYEIKVGATDSNDQRPNISGFYYSNFGYSVDVVAPGHEILSTLPGNSYGLSSGTSMSSPFVAGLAALILAKNPTLNLTNEEVRQILRLSTDDIGDSGRDLYFGFGRINAYKALSYLTNNPRPLTPIITSPSSYQFGSGASAPITGSTGSGGTFQSYKVEYGKGKTPTQWTLIATGTSPVTNGTLATWNTTLVDDDRYTIRLTSTDTAGKNYLAEVYEVEVNNIDTYLTYLTSSLPKGVVSIKGQLANPGTQVASYTLEWGMGFNPSSWSTQGITLIQDGQLIATLDTSQLPEQSEYTLKLTTTLSSGLKSVSTMDIFYQTSYLAKVTPEITAPGQEITFDFNIQDLLVPSDTSGKAAIYALNDANTDELIKEWVYLNSCSKKLGSSSNFVGSCIIHLPVNLNNGKYEVRIKTNDSPDLMRSNYFTISSTGIGVSPAITMNGGTVTYTYSGIQNPTNYDQVILFKAGDPTSATYLKEWQMINSCDKIVGNTTFPTGTCLMDIPTNTTKVPQGWYEIRLLKNNTYELIAKSNQFYVSDRSLSISPSKTKAGKNITISIKEMPIVLSSVDDKYLLYRQHEIQELAWVYSSSCTQTPGSSVVTDGSCLMTLPSSLADGLYQIRLQKSNGDTLALSNYFEVGGFGIDVTPKSVSPGGTVTLSWSGLPDPTNLDQALLFKKTDRTSPSYLAGGGQDWLFIGNCSKIHPTSPAPVSGSCQFPILSGVSLDDYEIRFGKNNTFELLGRSNRFEVK